MAVLRFYTMHVLLHSSSVCCSKGNRWKKADTYTEISGSMRMFIENVLISALAVFQVCYEQK